MSQERKKEEYIVAAFVVLFFGALLWWLIERGDTSMKIVSDDTQEDIQSVITKEKTSAEVQIKELAVSGAGISAFSNENITTSFVSPNIIPDSIPSIPESSKKVSITKPIVDSLQLVTIQDSDGDGLNDNIDVCPDKPGTKENNGCPEVQLSQEEKMALLEAVGNIQFITGSSQINASSEKSLMKIAELMKSHPEVTLTIDGHTDTQGDDVKNQELSVQRANSCKNFLRKQGISANRISTHGYGETKPIASNDTPEGREKNRRVNFTFL